MRPPTRLTFTMLASLILFAHIGLGPKTIALPMPELKASPVFVEQTKNESKELLAQTIRETVRAKIEANDSIVVSALDATTTADAELQITLLNFKQRNRSTQELLGSPNKGGSETTVEVSFTIVQGSDKATYPLLKGSAAGSYFGTTDRSDMIGAPTSKSTAIKVVNTQRAKALARAVWEAVRPTLETTFGWKSK